MYCNRCVYKLQSSKIYIFVRFSHLLSAEVTRAVILLISFMAKIDKPCISLNEKQTLHFFLFKQTKNISQALIFKCILSLAC